MWDILVLGTYLVLSVIYLWAYLRAEAGRMSHTAIRAISVVALIVAILVHNVTAWIFSLAPAHEFWHTALMGPWFVASALDCGTALVLIVCLALRRAGYLALDQKHVANLAKMLAVFVLVDLYFYACDLLTSGYFGGEGTEVVAMLTSGALAPSSGRRSRSWPSRSPSSSCRSCARPPASSWRLSLRSSACSASACRFSWAASQIPNLDMPGVTTQYAITNWQAGFTGAYQGMVYAPQPIEFGVTLGVLAMCVLFLLLGLKYLPLKPSENVD